MNAIALTVSTTTVTVAEGRATLTASVTNSSSVPARIVLGAFPPVGEAAAPTALAWTTIERPTRQVPAGATEQFTVVFAPDPGVAPGRYPVRLVAYSAERAPEEYADQAQSVAVVVPASSAAPPPPKKTWWPYALAAGALVVVVGLVVWLVVLRDPGVPPDSGATTDPTVTTDPTISTDPSVSTDPTVTADPGGGQTPTVTAEPGNGNEEARLNLVASPANAVCSYVPNGSLSGDDGLTVFFFFLVLGDPSDLDGSVRVQGSSDTGLSTSYFTRPSNQALSVAQFELRPADFGRRHVIAISVDSAGEVAETDESDNTIRVSVDLPSPRPTSVIDPLPCDVTRG